MNHNESHKGSVLNYNTGLLEEEKHHSALCDNFTSDCAGHC